VKRSQLLDRLAARLLELDRPHPVRVAIDDPDAAGKTTLADELAEVVAEQRPVIRAGIDGFHNPREIRFRSGTSSPEGYYDDSFDYQALRVSLLEPLAPGGSRRYRRAVFDYRSESEVSAPLEEAPADAVLLFDGIFLLRPELRPLWDLSIFVAADFDEILRRVERRDQALFGDAAAVRERYLTRYIPGQRLYFERVTPREFADVVIDNTNPSEPELIRS
jgi:uridine kinase